MSADRPRERARAPKAPNRTPLAYYRSGQQSEKSPFQPKLVKSRPKLSSRFIDFSIVILILLGIIYSLLVSPNPKLVVNSEAYHSLSTYRQAVVKSLQSPKNRTKLSFDDKTIIKSLKHQFPEIAEASIELPLFSQTPTVRLGIAEPSFFLNSGGVDFIIDSEGLAVAKSADLSRVRGLPVVIDQTGYDTKVGHQILSANEVNFINSLIAQAKRAKVSVSSLTLPALAQELDLRTTDRGYYVKFYLGGDVLVQAGQFIAARHQFDQSASQPSQYLDVRVPGKIYYK